MAAALNRESHQEEFTSGMKAPDEKDLEMLYDQYSAVLYGVIRWIIQDDAKAEETLYKTFTYIWNHFSSYDPSVQNICCWMIGIARRFSFEMLSPEEQMKISEEGMITTDQSVNEDRRILYYAFFKGWSIEQIAERLGTTPSRVKTLLHESVEHLKRENTTR